MLRIGNLELAHPFAQAAMSGYSDLPMRRIARRYGAHYTLGQVVLDRSVAHESEWQDRLLSVAPDDHPTGAQIMASDPTSVGPAVKRLVAAGYDVIDINFGCPVAKARRRACGGWLLGEPEVALAIVEETLQAAAGDCPVTLKMRRGLDDSAESERLFFSILEGAFDRGIAAATVHGRTVRQRYAGPSRWPFLRQVKQHFGNRTILGSGDLFDPASCLAMMAETGVDGVSIARGCLGNPWIFRNCLAAMNGEPQPPPPDLDEQRTIILDHFADALEHYPVEERAVVVFARSLMKYARHHPTPTRVRRAFQRVRTVTAFRELLSEWYAVERASPAA